MKKGIVCLLLMVCSTVGKAQNWNEFFRQKRTQIRYLVKQIAALQVYIELGQKGYGIYRDGLDVIGDIKDGDFNLHKDYFASLSTVNPRIAQSADVEEIIVWDEQVKILRRRVRQMQLHASQSSLDKLFDGLTNVSADHRAQLELLITGGNYQLKDEERLEHINKLHTEQLALFQFAKSTYQDALAFGKQQGKEIQEIKVIKQLQGLP